MRLLYRQARAVVAVSQGVASDLVDAVGVPAGLVRTIYNPIVTPDIPFLASAALAHPWFQPEQSPVILGVGRLVPEKDFATLIRAFAIVRRTKVARLVVLGEGPERSALEHLACELHLSGDVTFTGFVDNPLQYMRGAAIYVLSSAREGLPGTLIQAMACGTPVVSTDCPSGPAEILENGKWGRLVPVGDPVAMAEAISASLADVARPDVRRRSEDFGVDRAVRAYMHALGVDA